MRRRQSEAIVIQTDLHRLGSRFLGMKELPGALSNPAIMAMLQLDQAWPADDSVAWCSAFVNYIAHLLELPRSRSLAARSWTEIGAPISLDQAVRGRDIVVFTRAGTPKSPHKDAAGNWLSGHVAIYDSQLIARRIAVLGGNQGDAVSIAMFNVDDVIAVRRLIAA